jgi:hypothetical protein
MDVHVFAAAVQEAIMKYDTIFVMFFGRYLLQKAMYPIDTFIYILLVLFVYELYEFIQAGVSDQVFPAMPYYKRAVLAGILNIGMHLGTNGNNPVWKNAVRVLKKFDHFVPPVGTD